MLNSSSKSVVVLILSVGLVIFVPITVLSRYFGANPLHEADQPNFNLISLFPQGWKFFTRDARSPMVHLIQITPGGMKLINQRNFSPAYAFGLDRSNRILAHEAGYLERALDKDSAKQYTFQASNIEDFYTSINVDTLTFTPINCARKIVPDLQGKYLLVIQSMLPWYLLHRAKKHTTRFYAFPVEINHYD